MVTGITEAIEVDLRKALYSLASEVAVRRTTAIIPNTL